MNTWVEITRFGQHVCASLDIDRVEEVVLTSVPRLIGVDAVGVYILDERHMPVRVTRCGASDALVYDIEALGRRTDPFLRRLLQTREPVDDLRLYGGSDWLRQSRHGQVLAAHGFAHSMIVPMFQNGRLIGTINLARGRGSVAFGLSDTGVGAELGRFAAIGITNALLHAGGLREASAATLRTVPLASQRVEDPMSGLLTPREVQVLELVALGLQNVEIAGELKVTVHTIKQHLKNAYQKLGVRSRVQAIRHLGLG